MARNGPGNFDPEREREILHEQGVSALSDAFSRDWGPTLIQDYETERQAAIAAHAEKSRGPQRIWFPAQPTRTSRFFDLIMHPYFVGVCQAVLGPDYEIVELGFDTPSAGARDQPWHRDFPKDRGIDDRGAINYLAFNVSLRDHEDGMGAFQIAPGTHFLAEPDIQLARGMFVYKRYYDRFTADAVQSRQGRLGAIQVRSPLTLHRGTEHRSPVPRPVMVFGATVPDRPTPEHLLPVTQGWIDGLAPEQQEYLHRHVRYQLVDDIDAVAIPGTDVEELMMSKEDLIPY